MTKDEKIRLYDKYSNIRNLRGYRDYDVCKACEIAPSVISAWKSGVNIPKVDKLKKISVFLEVPITELI